MNKPFIIAEMSANHLGSFDRALKIVKAAVDAGADAIKLQTWTPDTMCLDREYTLTSGIWAGRKLFDLYREAFTPWEWHKPIFDYAKSLGIVAFSSPFDKASVDFLETLDCPIYKIASYELVDLELIEYVASKGKPMIMSTGMASFEEVSAAWEIPKFSEFTMLKCASSYPADASDVNLETMPKLHFSYGLSDHTQGIGVAIVAAAMGADVIEKHLTLSRADGGLDASFSMEPDEFRQMVTECRRAAKALGTVKYGGESTELRRSLYFTKDLKAGDTIVKEDICTARPALGLPPSQLKLVVGCQVSHDIAKYDPVKMTDLC